MNYPDTRFVMITQIGIDQARRFSERQSLDISEGKSTILDLILYSMFSSLSPRLQWVKKTLCTIDKFCALNKSCDDQFFMIRKFVNRSRVPYLAFFLGVVACKKI